MSGQRSTYRGRMIGAFALAVVWVLFGAYICLQRHPEPDYPPADARAMALVRQHLQAAPPDAFSQPSTHELLISTTHHPARPPRLTEGGSK